MGRSTASKVPWQPSIRTRFRRLWRVLFAKAGTSLPRNATFFHFQASLQLLDPLTILGKKMNNELTVVALQNIQSRQYSNPWNTTATTTQEAESKIEACLWYCWWRSPPWTHSEEMCPQNMEKIKSTNNTKPLLDYISLSPCAPEETET